MNYIKEYYYNKGNVQVICNYISEPLTRRRILSANIDESLDNHIQEYWKASLDASNATSIGIIGIPDDENFIADFQNDEHYFNTSSLEEFNNDAMISNGILEIDDINIGESGTLYTTVEQINDIYQTTVTDRIIGSTSPPSQEAIIEAYNTITSISSTGAGTDETQTSIHLLPVLNKYYDNRLIDMLQI